MRFLREKEYTEEEQFIRRFCNFIDPYIREDNKITNKNNRLFVNKIKQKQQMFGRLKAVQRAYEEFKSEETELRKSINKEDSYTERSCLSGIVQRIDTECFINYGMVQRIYYGKHSNAYKNYTSKKLFDLYVKHVFCIDNLQEEIQKEIEERKKFELLKYKLQQQELLIDIEELGDVNFYYNNSKMEG